MPDLGPKESYALPIFGARNRTPGEILQFRHRPHHQLAQLSVEMALGLAAVVDATRRVMTAPAVPTKSPDEIAIGIAVALSDAGWVITREFAGTPPEAA